MIRLWTSQATKTELSTEGSNMLTKKMMTLLKQNYKRLPNKKTIMKTINNVIHHSKRLSWFRENKLKYMWVNFFFTNILLIHLIQSSFLNTQLIRWLVLLNYVYIYSNTISIIYSIIKIITIKECELFIFIGIQCKQPNHYCCTENQHDVIIGNAITEYHICSKHPWEQLTCQNTHEEKNR